MMLLDLIVPRWKRAARNELSKSGYREQAGYRRDEHLAHELDPPFSLGESGAERFPTRNCVSAVVRLSVRLDSAAFSSYHAPTA